DHVLPACPARRLGLIGPNSAHLHPGFEIRDLRRIERAGRRHFETLMLARHCLDQKAAIGIPGNDGRAGLATLQNEFTRIETKIAEFRVGVTSEALVRKDRPDLLLEELFTLVGW